MRRDERELLVLASSLYLKSMARKEDCRLSTVKRLNETKKIINDEFSFLLKINSGDIGDCIKQKLQTAD